MLRKPQNVEKIIPIFPILVAGKRGFPFQLCWIEGHEGWRGTDDLICQVIRPQLDVALQTIAAAFVRWTDRRVDHDFLPSVSSPIEVWHRLDSRSDVSAVHYWKRRGDFQCSSNRGA